MAGTAPHLLGGTALQLADNQGVLAEGDDRAERAKAFRAELHNIHGAIDVIDGVARQIFIEQAWPERAASRAKAVIDG